MALLEKRFRIGYDLAFLCGYSVACDFTIDSSDLKQHVLYLLFYTIADEYYEYFVHGKQYETYNYFGDYSIKEGDCYKVKYSKDDPIVSEILFEEGTVDCNK